MKIISSEDIAETIRQCDDPIAKAYFITTCLKTLTLVELKRIRDFMGDNLSKEDDKLLLWLIEGIDKFGGD